MPEKGTQQEVTATGGQGTANIQQPYESLVKRVANATSFPVPLPGKLWEWRKGSILAIEEIEEIYQALGENVVVEMTGY